MVTSNTQLERVTETWPCISHVVRLPRSEDEYRDLINVLDQLTETVGEDENHPLASLMDVLGVLIERYEDESILELRE